MVIDENKIGNTTIRIYDDSIVKTPEEVKQILRNIGKIVMQYEVKSAES